MSFLTRLGGALLALLTLSLPAAAASRERLSLDQGWLFHRGEVPAPAVKGHGMSYQNGKANGSWGAAAADLDDSDRRRLDLPHDRAVESHIDPSEKT
jgi:beta-galactosidase